MKNPKVKKLIITLSTLSLCLGAAQAFASAEPQARTVENGSGIVQPRNIIITSCDHDFSIGSLGKLTCSADTEVPSGYTSKTTVELQQNDGGWTTIKTWTDSGSAITSVEKTHYATKGYSYRLKITHQAYRGSTLVETITDYSNTISY